MQPENVKPLLKRMLTIIAVTAKILRFKIKDKLLSNHNVNVIN